MLSFHGKQEVKDFYLDRVIKHQEADEIIKGIYWQNGKGCAVGCTVHCSDHDDYESELGIPRILAVFEDVIFENLPNYRAKTWPKQFLEAIKVGVDLSDVWPKFAVWLLTDEKYGVIKYSKVKKQKYAIQKVSDCYCRYKEITTEEWKSCLDAAADAAKDASISYVAYADSVDATHYAYAAEHAARAASYAASAFYDHVDAAYASCNAATAFAAHYASDIAVSAPYTYAAADAYGSKIAEIRLAQADKLLELLRECK